ncbi:hypothetical protein WOLCODRAFT_167462 [Wolfiporia cocos MD-104 SS10]|uniref:Uncharacterized protein n=1 Tax=Wolfiporia cocos (strain MD-104) TaxID=742152 RepID=A0A2H3J639_WOLCO|nr:hypothetical protein WOLCODRAFT_167462 [Wolfiporia cocos MD-104 SS10]
MLSRPTTGRLRSKTSDLSDLLRGGRADARPPEANLLPPLPALPELDASSAKAKTKISFFTRRRKSTSVSPSSAKIKSAEAKTPLDADAVSAPHADQRQRGLSIASKGTARNSISTPPSPNVNDSIPSSLPPLNVSPPSFGALAQFTPSKNQPEADSASVQQKGPSSIATIRAPRSQRSASFEQSRRSEDKPANYTHAPSKSGKRPIITVSPPHIEEEDETQCTTPRTPPTPPLRSAIPQPGFRSSHTSRERDGRDARASGSRPSSMSPPSSPSTPQSPLRFPMPPRSSNSLRRGSRSDASGDELVSSAASISSKSSHDALTSFAKASQGRLHRHATTTAASLPKVVGKQKAPVEVPQSIPEGTSQSDGSTAAGHAPSSPSSARSKIPSSTSAPSLHTRKVPPPLLTALRKPRAGPPAEPLPSPPPTAPLQGTTPEREEDCPPMTALPTIPTLASHISVGQVHHMLFRSRASTVSSMGSAITVGNDATGNGSLDMPPTPNSSTFAQTTLKTPVREITEDHNFGEVASIEQLRDALNAQSAKYKRLSSYLLTLSERHAAEKNELMHRIEVLEDQARRREREITGLRWLVMNAGQRAIVKGDSPPPISAVARLRSGSKPSQPSPILNGAGELQRGMSLESTFDSIEEGLVEMQKSVSDLIAPLASSPLKEDAIASPITHTTSPINTNGAAVSRVRSNTLTDGAAQHPVITAVRQRQARRTSSPVLPAISTGLGLDVDIPTIPSLPDLRIGQITPAGSSSGSVLSSLPSLTAAETASSGLSSIPETPRRAFDGNTDKAFEGEQSPKSSNEVHTTRITGSMSTSSSAPTGSNSNAKIDSSPSIGQVLDRTAKKEPDMDTILQKLREYGLR